MLRMQKERVTRLATASLAPFLVLFAPYLSYVQYQNHGFQNADVAVFAVILAGTAILLGLVASRWPVANAIILGGLLTLLVDIQSVDLGLKRLGPLFVALSLVLYLLRRHASRIVSSGMVALVLSLLLFPVRFEAGTTGRAQASEAQASLPLVVHVLLDEMIGAEGIPQDLAPAGFKRNLSDFFVERGFRLYGRAYSEYPATLYSVTQLLNLSTDGYRNELSAPGPSDGTFRLTQNKYFEQFAKRGYAIKVHEPDYLYLCPENVPASCRTYASRSLKVLESLDVPLSTKLSVVAGTYFVQSEVYRRAKDAYGRVRHRLPGVPLPAWNWDLGIPTTASSLEMFEAVSKDVANARGGMLVFAHILLPHYPYVYGADCRPRPVEEWLQRNDSELGDGAVNLPEGRAARYAAYLQQVSCGQQQLAHLFDSIPASLRQDAIVIVQGDHGSRIAMTDPVTDARQPLVTSDFADSYSTMFAVRSRAIPSGYDLQSASITCLLRGLVESGFRSGPGIAACSASRSVYLLTDGKPSKAHPLPDFGVTGTTATTSVAARQEPDLTSRPAR